MGTKKRLFLILWSAGFVGILSFLLIDLKSLLAILPLPPGTQVPQIDPLLLKVISLIQPTVILSVAVLIGVGLASKVGLSAPVAERAASGGDWAAALKPQLVPGIIGGIVGGIAIVLTAAAAKPFLPSEAVRLIGEFGKLLPLPTRLLYGGFTEELLLRWGFMTLLVWAAWRLFQKGQDSPKAPYVVGAILISSSPTPPSA
ncbi:MAG: CPBP family intramembrane glutamate endopeptidase [Acidobacteriota bacterium]